MTFALGRRREHVIPTNLRDGYQIRHILKVAALELGITPGRDFRQSLVDLRTEFLLAISVLGQLPKCEGQLGEL